MKVESESEVAQSCPILRDPIDLSLPASSIHGIFQARVLEWVAIAFSRSDLSHSNRQINPNWTILSLICVYEDTFSTSLIDRTE